MLWVSQVVLHCKLFHKETERSQGLQYEQDGINEIAFLVLIYDKQWCVCEMEYVFHLCHPVPVLSIPSGVVEPEQISFFYSMPREHCPLEYYNDLYFYSAFYLAKCLKIFHSTTKEQIDTNLYTEKLG